MTEIASVPIIVKKSRPKLIIMVLSVLALFLIYGAGFIALPVSVLATYQNRNCDSALSLNSVYNHLYPKFIRDQSLSAPIKECEAYRLGASNEEKGNWKDSYDAYQAYSTNYPNGLYVQDAHQHSATALLNLAKNQSEAKQYEDAVSNLDLIISSFPETNAAAEAWPLFPPIYTSWGTGFRESGDFEKSEQVLNKFKTWSETYQKPDSTTDAKGQLAQTYLAWGQNLQSQKQYEAALAKFDMATNTGSTSEVQSSQRKLYIEWGNNLVAQKDFARAIEKFEIAISKADGNTDHVANDALVSGQIQWAQDFSVKEDFQAALEHLQTAKESAVSDASKKSLDTAFQDTYLAFSKSTGPQARRVMKDALKTVCEKHKAPDLPIFGLNKDSVRFGIYGVDEKLPEALAATTPGEMHYVACINAESKIIESRTRKNIVLKFSGGYFYTLVKQNRAQIIWNVILLKTDTGKYSGETTLEGSTPPPFPEGDDSGGFFYGTPPLDDLTEWLPVAIQ